MTAVDMNPSSPTTGESLGLSFLGAETGWVKYHVRYLWCRSVGSDAPGGSIAFRYWRSKTGTAVAYVRDSNSERPSAGQPIPVQRPGWRVLGIH
jgi:hypothetical protein